RVRGRVEVRTGKATRCDGLKAALAWHAQGKGNAESHRLEEVTLFEGAWAADEALSYPFAFEVPDTPVPYAGTLFEVGFRIEADADVPWAFDPRAQRGVRVAQRTVRVAVGPIERGSTGFERGCLGCSVLLLLAGIGLAVQGQIGGGFLPLLCFGALGIFASLGTVLAERKLGNVKIALVPGTAGGYRTAASTPNGMDCRVSFRAGLRNAPTVTCALTVRERARKGSGSNTRTMYEELFARSITLEREAPGRYRGFLELPHPTAVPPALKGTSNGIDWEVKVDIDVPDWPDWSQTFPLPAEAEKTR
ncbi:MAG: hypothetical protein AAGH15_21605, partial [Myxococcota bacterium]